MTFYMLAFLNYVYVIAMNIQEKHIFTFTKFLWWTAMSKADECSKKQMCCKLCELISKCVHCIKTLKLISLWAACLVLFTLEVILCLEAWIILQFTLRQLFRDRESNMSLHCYCYVFFLNLYCKGTIESQGILWWHHTCCIFEVSKYGEMWHFEMWHVTLKCNWILRDV